jgi:hypothetical protein
LVDLVGFDRVQPIGIGVERDVEDGQRGGRAGGELGHQRFSVKLGHDQFARARPAFHADTREFGQYKQRSAQDGKRQQALEQRQSTTIFRGRKNASVGSICRCVSHGFVLSWP